MASRRFDYVYIRVFATILVVIGHCWFVDSQYGFDEKRLPGMNTPYYLDLFCRFIYSFHMPLFFALSGALMALGGNVRMTFASFVKKKTYRLLLPFLVVTTFYCIPIRYLVGVYTSDIPIIKVVIEQYVTLIDTHLWFLPSLFFCMIWVMIIQRLRKSIDYRILLVCAFFVHLFFIVRDPFPVMNWLMFRRSFKYLFPFMIGFMISEYNIVEKIRKRLIIIAIGMFIFMEVLFLSELPLHSLIYSEGITILSVFVFFCVFYRVSKLQDNQCDNCIVTYLDKHSFEIFLYHAPINFIILRACELNGGWVYPNWVFFWLRFMLTLGGSLIISYFVRVNYGQR